MTKILTSGTTTSSDSPFSAAAAALPKLFQIRLLRSSYSPAEDDSSSSSSSSSSSPEATESKSDPEKPRLIHRHGVSSIVGRRREMEDAVHSQTLTIGSLSFDFFGVYDGHGGARVAEACRGRMHRILANEIKDHQIGSGVEWEEVMMRCFERMDREVGDEKDVEEMTVGSTAVVAVVDREEIVIANCGDSRAVLCRCGVALPLSVDHKPDRPDELARIEAAGGRVINWNGPRISGVLATSRSIGDHYLRPYVTSQPEVKVYKRTKDDEFLILATDGLWDVVSNEAACQVVRRCLSGRIRRECIDAIEGVTGRTRSHPADAAALLAELAVAKGSMDNVSVVVVPLRKFRKSARSKIHSKILTILVIICEICALIWYSLSYIPFARRVVSNMMIRVFDTEI